MRASRPKTADPRRRQRSPRPGEKSSDQSGIVDGGTLVVDGDATHRLPPIPHRSRGKDRLSGDLRPGLGRIQPRSSQVRSIDPSLIRKKARSEGPASIGLPSTGGGAAAAGDSASKPPSRIRPLPPSAGIYFEPCEFCHLAFAVSERRRETAWRGRSRAKRWERTAFESFSWFIPCHLFSPMPLFESQPGIETLVLGPLSQIHGTPVSFALKPASR